MVTLSGPAHDEQGCCCYHLGRLETYLEFDKGIRVGCQEQPTETLGHYIEKVGFNVE